MSLTPEYEQYITERRQCDALKTVASEHDIPLAHGQGAFMVYCLARDSHIDAEERSRVSKLGGYDNLPEDYKVHINPDDEQLFSAFTGLVDLARQSSSFRAAIDEFKVWIGGTAAEHDDVPRLVLYPRNGQESNARTIVGESVSWLANMGVSGSGRVPRFNLPVIDGFVYVAQGSGYDKEEDPWYLRLFDGSVGYALIDRPTRELRDLIGDVQAKA